MHEPERMPGRLYASLPHGYHLSTTQGVVVNHRSGEIDLIEYLLDLDGEIFPLDSGHWASIEIKKVQADKRRPHGLKYSLTLHDSSNRRVLGFDNAHAFKSKRSGYAVASGRKDAFDHVHRESGVRPYAFRGAGQLLEDFWTEVYEIMQRRYKEP
jgi:hypothetical protein